MKKFLCKLCVFILLTSSVLLILNWLYFPISLKIDLYGVKKYQDMPGRIQICNFGSSHGLHAFNYDGVSDKFSCFNFATESQTLTYDYRLLQHYIDRIDEGGIVFIVVSYFSLFGRPEEETERFISRNNRYYKILPAELIKNYDFITDVIINYLPVLTFDTGRTLKVISGRQKEKEADDTKTAERFDDIKDVGEKRAAFHFAGIRPYEDGRIIFNHEKEDALYKMIELCRKKNLIPILVRTPYLTEYSEPVKRDSEFMKVSGAALSEVLKKTGVRYYDYSEDERFSHDYKIFDDTDHLNNSTGGLKFTNILISEVMHDLKQ